MILSKNPATAWRVIEGEAVILSLDSKVFRGLNAVGSRVWELIDGRRSVEEIVALEASELTGVPVPSTSMTSRNRVERPASALARTGQLASPPTAIAPPILVRRCSWLPVQLSSKLRYIDRIEEP